ncbi:MAG: SMI1/KNR4 family protein [Candidatus Nomurabacteria bacterium]|jgi:hypothetical protein|nr:SMI1/KNR4 family protein [Candidatus Nomurabacteria bacterium]
MEKNIELLKKYADKMGLEKPATRAEISDFEKKNGVTFSEDFKEFLLFANGGEIFVPGDVFFGVNDSSRYYSISREEKILDKIENSVPDGMVIVGKTNFGDPFFLEQKSGEVIEWDHESDEESLRWKSFGEFLKDQIDEALEILGEENLAD